jgi:uncharacterized protein YxjI
VGPFEHDVYRLDQVIRPIANIYRVTPLAGGQPAGEPIAYVRQKKLKVKEDIRFFADDSERESLFRLKARAVLELGGRYDVLLPDDRRIGTLEKAFGKSLLRSTWRVLDADEQELAVVKERSVPVALLRRALDFLPEMVWIPILFHFTIDADGEHLGDFTRAVGLRDTYTLDLSSDPGRRIDRRLAVALAVALDALQSR